MAGQHRDDCTEMSVTMYKASELTVTEHTAIQINVQAARPTDAVACITVLSGYDIIAIRLRFDFDATTTKI